MNQDPREAAMMRFEICDGKIVIGPAKGGASDADRYLPMILGLGTVQRAAATGPRTACWIANEEFYRRLHEATNHQ